MHSPGLRQQIVLCITSRVHSSAYIRYLSGAAFLTQKQLDETKLGDNETQLPPYLKPPAHWNVRTDEQIEEG